MEKVWDRKEERSKRKVRGGGAAGKDPRRMLDNPPL